jgi:hypothetical protein
MMRKPSLRDFAAAPELLEVQMAEVALHALEIALRLVHGQASDDLEDSLPPYAPVLARALRLIDTCEKLQGQLRAYRRAVLRAMRTRPDDTPF